MVSSIHTRIESLSSQHKKKKKKQKFCGKLEWQDWSLVVKRLELLLHALTFQNNCLKMATGIKIFTWQKYMFF
jgi:hypothetical protein